MRDRGDSVLRKNWYYYILYILVSTTVPILLTSLLQIFQIITFSLLISSTLLLNVHSNENYVVDSHANYAK